MISGKVSATYCNSCLNKAISSSFSILQIRITINSPVLDVRTIIAQHPFLRTQIDERVIVLVGIVAYRIADTVGYIILQPAFLYGQYLVEGVGNVETYRVHLLVHHVLPDFFRSQPAFVGKSVFEFIPIELRFLGAEYRRYFRKLYFPDAGKVVRYLFLLVFYLL